MKESTLSADLIERLQLKDLLFLQRIADLRSLSGAATQLGQTQPAASRWLRELEELFQCHLFIRDRRVGMTPTPLGELVVARSRALLADVGSLSSDMVAQRQGRGGRLQLGVIPYFSSRLLERLVSVLAGEFGMTVSILEAATEPLVEALQMQRVQAILGRCSPHPLASGLRQELLYTQQACLLVHAANRLQGQTGLEGFASYRWIAPPTGSPTWHAIVAAYGDAGAVPPAPVVETASIKLVHALVAANPDMVAVLPLDIGTDLEHQGGVRVLPFPVKLRMPALGLLAHARHWNFSNIATLRTTLCRLVASAHATW